MKIRPLKRFLFRFSITLQSIRRGAQKAKLEKPFYDALQKENRMNKYVKGEKVQQVCFSDGHLQPRVLKQFELLWVGFYGIYLALHHLIEAVYRFPIG